MNTGVVRRPPGGLLWLVVLGLAAGAAGCAPRAIRLPEGPGQPFADYEQAFAEASADCRGVRTLTLEASVSGAVGGGRVRGRVIAGFARPGRMRLEAVAPMGAPAFILAADGGTGTLLIPRAREVLTGEPTESVLEAVIGVSVRPDDLQAILVGCVAVEPRPTSGSQFSGGWVRVELEGGSVAYLRQEGGRWRILAGTRPLLAVQYELAENGRRLPAAVRLQSAANGGPGANLRIKLSEVDTNVPIAAKAFTVAVPDNALPITLADLRQAGPFGDRR